MTTDSIWEIEDEEYAARRRKLAFWLRHKPESGGIALDDHGWADAAALLAALEAAELPTSEAMLTAIVRGDPKHRFEADAGRVRARFGHSLELTAPLVVGMPPATLFYGVSPKYAAKVAAAGIEPMRRTHVHLATSRAAASGVATRRGVAGFVFQVDAHAAYQAGVAFYPRGRGVWLSDPIAADYVTAVSPPPGSGEAEDDGGIDEAPRGRRPYHGPRKLVTPKHRRRRK